MRNPARSIRRGREVARDTDIRFTGADHCGGEHQRIGKFFSASGGVFRPRGPATW